MKPLKFAAAKARARTRLCLRVGTGMRAATVASCRRCAHGAHSSHRTRSARPTPVFASTLRCAPQGVPHRLNRAYAPTITAHFSEET